VDKPVENAVSFVKYCVFYQQLFDDRTAIIIVAAAQLHLNTCGTRE
jgi:hypothetical protein